MKILHVVGARPNYIKTAAVMTEMARFPSVFTQVLVHTGQHYDEDMSRIFFDDLGMAQPDEYLGVGSGTHAEQTARTMLAFEPVLCQHKPDWVVVVGDVNSTLACALVSAKLGIPVAHIEAGLRSRDWSMPEEINRVLTDQIASLLFTPSRDANINLQREGVEPGRIHFVGNVMIDTLVRMLPLTDKRAIVAELGVEPGQFVLVTLHRPANVDAPAVLREIVSALNQIGSRYPVVFPMHPRTRERIESLGMFSDSRIHWLGSLGYLDFLALMRRAKVVLTDSGGIQEETTYLGVPCLTLRPNTERPITIEVGTNQLVRAERQAILSTLEKVVSADIRKGQIPELWDGLAARRIVDVMRAL